MQYTNFCLAALALVCLPNDMSCLTTKIPIRWYLLTSLIMLKDESRFLLYRFCESFYASSACGKDGCAMQQGQQHRGLLAICTVNIHQFCE